MKKTIIPLLLFLFLLCGCASSEERAWQSGQKALAKEEFAEAAAAFERAGTFQDADKQFSVQRKHNGDVCTACA